MTHQKLIGIQTQSMYQENCAQKSLYTYIYMNKDNGTKNGKWELGYVVYAHVPRFNLNGHSSVK